MKKLSEIMAEKALKKEQKRAEREAHDIEQDGAVIATKLSRSTYPVVLKPIADLIRSFASDEGRERFRARFSAKNRKLLESIEGQIDDAWLGRAADYLETIPSGRAADARRLSWKDWLDYGAQVGWPETDVVGTLRLVFVLAAQSAQAQAEQFAARR